MKIGISDAYKVEIFIAGNYEEALRLAQEYCDDVGLCVTVTPTRYVYTGGMESGVIVGLINYARFPKYTHQILEQAINLGEKLRIGLHQQSFTVQDGIHSRWYNYRDDK